MRVMQRRDLDSALVDQLGIGFVEPSILQRLSIQIGPRIWRGNRYLERMRVDFSRKANGFFDGFLGFAGKPEDKRAVDGDAELVAALRNRPRHVDPHAFLDVVKNLLIAG